MASLDRDWNIGVSGWEHEGRHLRLAELLTLVDTDEERQALVEEHRNACVLLALVLEKLKGELDEVTDL